MIRTEEDFKKKVKAFAKASQEYQKQADDYLLNRRMEQEKTGGDCKYHITEEEHLKTKRHDMKKKTQIKVYILLAVLTFGAATVNEDFNESESVSVAVAGASVLSAAAWPLYWSWQGASFLKTITFRISLGENER